MNLLLTNTNPGRLSKSAYWTRAMLASFLLLIGGYLVPASAQTTLAKWTFETSAPTTGGPVTPEVGSGSASSNTGGTFTSTSGWGSAKSWVSSGWNSGEYFQFNTSSTTFSGITVSWQQVGSNTGPKNFQLQYSTDGTNFTTHAAYAVNLSTWNSGTLIAPPADQYSYDLSTVTSLNNAANIYFRLTVVDTVSINGGTVAGGGTGRVDNFTITTAPPSGTPLISVTSSLPAFAAFLGFPSASQSFVVTGTSLTTTITLAAPTGFEVSSDNLTFSSSASLPAEGGTGYARVADTALLGSVTGSITLSSTGAVDKTVGLTGTVTDPNVLSLAFAPTSIPEDSVAPAVGTISIPRARASDLVVTLVSANTAAVTVPATATITAGNLTTTFNANAVAAPSSFVTNSSVITASAAGLTNGTATLQVTNVDVAPIVSVSLLANTPYVQDFDNLGTTVLTNVVSATIGSQTNIGPLTNATLNGWYATKIAGDGTLATSISPDTGSGTSGLVNNYGAAAASDRALGVLASSSNIMAVGALIKNDTGGTLTGLSLSMTAEFWRSSTLTQNTLTFGYGKISGAITSANFLSSSGAGVLPLSAANIVGPAFGTSSAALDGNNATNQAAFTNISLPLTLLPGESAFIRWQDVNDNGNDAGLAIDNLTINGVGSAPSNTYSSWALTNTGSASSPVTGDHDNDGVSNGLEYFMGATGSTFTANPGIVDGKITWPKDPAFLGSYTVQTSPDLTAWTPVSSTVVGNTVEYTPTGPAPLFIRMAVTPTPTP
ncbi:MAG: hypothetical protein ABI600_21055 [Luteolibacter sp.]